jgi:hypothetical protein
VLVKVLSSLLRLVTVDRYVFKSQPLQIAKRLAAIIFGIMKHTTIKIILILILSLILFITNSAIGQTTIRGTTTITTDGVVSDTINRSPNLEFEKRINLEPINSSGFDIEIRFYKLTTVTNKRNLRLVRFIKGQWESFEYDENKKSKILKYTVVPTIGYHDFLTNLMTHNLTYLPDQSDLDRKIQDSFASKKEYLQSSPCIMDDCRYTIEFKFGEKFRIYQFHNPETYAKYYDNVEWKNYIFIQNLFEKGLVRK